MTELAVARLRDAPASSPARVLIRAGAEASMVEDFRSLAEATDTHGDSRYGAQTVLAPLARFLVGSSLADTALYELCHLVAAVDACGQAADRRNAFFLGPEAASAARFKAQIAQARHKGGWRRAGFAQVDGGIGVSAAEVPFTVRYGRMPFLAAVYEFMAGMENFTFYAELQTIFDEMGARGLTVKALQTATNRIASRLRQYRRANLVSHQHEGKFNLLLAFLKLRSPNGHLVIDDASILGFWREKSASGDFRTYRAVFDTFCHFVRSLEQAARAEAMAMAYPIGTDRDQGEVEPDDSAGSVESTEWLSPFIVLDEAPASAIRFFKKDSERKPIEALMHYGPMAMRLPLAFLRLETFGPVQSAITTDLQLGRDMNARIDCDGAAPYPETLSNMARILDFVRRLQKATFYALHSEGGGYAAYTSTPETMETLESVLAEAAKTFRAIARKGFDEAGLCDAQRIEGFRSGAGALVAIAEQIARYLETMQRRGCALEDQFVEDRAVFRKTFGLLYGSSP